jgi:DNA-binding GntR family transcriptional regulator
MNGDVKCAGPLRLVKTGWYGGYWISPVGVGKMPQIQVRLPKYLQVADHIRELILRGDLKPGDEVPSERRIVEEWGVSRPTATRALAALRTEGLIEAHQGSGTFVRAQPLLNRRAIDRYARARETGKAYTRGERSEITHAEETAASETVATGLGVEVGSTVIRRRRIIFDESGPLEVSISWFTQNLAIQAPRIAQKTRIREGTLAYVERVANRVGRRARDRIMARGATADEKNALGLRGSRPPVLVVHHLVLDQLGNPLEFVEAVYPPERWAFESEYLIRS